MMGRRFGIALLVVTVAVSIFLYAGSPVLTWYYLHGLTHADEADREGWVKRLVGMDQEAVPGLLDCLRGEDERGCENVAAALTALIDASPARDPRRLELAARLEGVFARCGGPGQRQ